MPVRWVEFATPSRFASRDEERRELVLVEHVVRLVPGHVLLEQPEAVRVDRPDEQPDELVERRRAHPLLDARRRCDA